MSTATGIMKDNVTFEKYMRFGYATACEDCTHFDQATTLCTLGYPTKPHLRENQIRDLKENGQIAFCRTQEID